MTSKLTVITRGQSFELEQGRPSTSKVNSFELTMSTQKYHVHRFLEHNANIEIFSHQKSLRMHLQKHQYDYL
jgi:hypothetical protein